MTTQIESPTAEPFALPAHHEGSGREPRRSPPTSPSATARSACTGSSAARSIPSSGPRPTPRAGRDSGCRSSTAASRADCSVRRLPSRSSPRPISPSGCPCSPRRSRTQSARSGRRPRDIDGLRRAVAETGPSRLCGSDVHQLSPLRLDRPTSLWAAWPTGQPMRQACRVLTQALTRSTSALNVPEPTTRKPPALRGFLSKRLMGFEPTTFCMASRPGACNRLRLFASCLPIGTLPVLWLGAVCGFIRTLC